VGANLLGPHSQSQARSAAATVDTPLRHVRRKTAQGSRNFCSVPTPPPTTQTTRSHTRRTLIKLPTCRGLLLPILLRVTTGQDARVPGRPAPSHGPARVLVMRQSLSIDPIHRRIAGPLPPTRLTDVVTNGPRVDRCITGSRRQGTRTHCWPVSLYPTQIKRSETKKRVVRVAATNARARCGADR
jgi:hypothetical protein